MVCLIVVFLRHFCLLLFSFFSSFEVFGLVPLFVYFFPFFFNNITYQEGGKGWGFLLDANLVEMF